MRLFVMVLSVTLLCASCGTSSEAAQSDPNAVHQQWITALQHGDRDAALVIAAPQTLREQFVDEHVNRMRELITKQTNGRVRFGALHRVDVQPTTDAAGQRVGLSMWRFAEYTVCYDTTLAQTNQAWGVVSWGARANCPPEVQP